MKKYNIVVDENIAFPECFEFFGNVIKVKGREISNPILKECDFLIVRSVTRVDENLLKNTRVKFVGTTTSGFEHVDIDFLSRNKIHFAVASGCNSFAVSEYVITSIAKLLSDSQEQFIDKTVGIVGYGNIGTKVAKMCQVLGMKIKINDPPLNRTDKTFKSVSLNEILNCEIITLHVPLTFQDEDKTINLFDENLQTIKENSILINTSRGGVVNELKLLEVLNQKKIKLVTDVWINEPDVNIDLLAESDIATPHIAGYSIEGKVNGTKMIFEQLNNFLGTNYKFDFLINHQGKEIIKFDDDISPKSIYELLKRIYNIERDSSTMKRMLIMKSEEKKIFFDELRKNYPHRKSFNDYLIKTSNKSVKSILEGLRFIVTII
jgi:erythronate-4-phosphate dehydrogenase